MKSPHLLHLGNPRKVKENLAGLLDAAALLRIENEIENNTARLLELARVHYRFAIRQSSPQWRHKVSRFYYAGYHAARALRLYVHGEYSTEVKDHHKFDKLPNDFPGLSRYTNQLAVLRGDRNTCDYDHLSRAGDLILGTRGAHELVSDFMRDVTQYLRDRGLRV